jgi:hypothetical protein
MQGKLPLRFFANFIKLLFAAAAHRDPFLRDQILVHIHS